MYRHDELFQEEAEYSAPARLGRLEEFVRNRFDTMAADVRRERAELARLLSIYEGRKHASDRSDVADYRREYQERKVLATLDNDRELEQNKYDSKRCYDRRHGRKVEALKPGVQSAPGKLRASSNFSVSNSVSDSVDFDLTKRTQTGMAARPRYATDTASSRIRVLQTEKGIKERLSRDVPAHDDVYPVPLHLASRLGIDL